MFVEAKREKIKFTRKRFEKKNSDERKGMQIKLKKKLTKRKKSKVSRRHKE